MEEKIYHRQVNKQSLAQRVIDEHQLDRHFTSQELAQLYSFEPDANTEVEHDPVMNDPDVLLNTLLKYFKEWISKYHEHDSLLENKVHEGLSEDERKLAWEEFEQERNRVNNYNSHLMNMNQNNLMAGMNVDINGGFDLFNVCHNFILILLLI
jgi:transcriptional regulator ATRX